MFFVADLFPTTTVLFMFPYASTAAFTLNTALSPAPKSIIQVMVLVDSSYLPLWLALINFKPLPRVSTMTTCFASLLALLLTVIVYSTLSPKLGVVLLTSLAGMISGIFTVTAAVLLPTVTSLVTSVYPTILATTVNVLVSPEARSTFQIIVLVLLS